MRIGIDARFYGSLGKGLGRYTEKLITHLEAAGGESNHTYIVFLRRENFDEYQPRVPQFKKILADYPWYGWQEQILFPLLIARSNLDLMHFPHFNVPILVTAPFIVTIHDLILLHFPTVKATELPPFLYWLKYMAYRAVISHAIRRSQAIITVSNFTKTDLETVYPAARNKITVTPEAADAFCFLPDDTKEQALFQSIGLSLSDEDERDRISIKPFILYVGNAYPHKNLSLIIRMATLFPAYEFLCVGREDFFYRAFKRAVESAGCRNVHFTGHVDDQLLGGIYRRASAYLFPSLYEGFGLPGLEAMTYGTPVVAARAGSLPEIYGEGAYFFDPQSVESCAEALRVALSEANNSETSRSLRFHRAALFSWNRMAQETKALYEVILNRRYYKQ